MFETKLSNLIQDKKNKGRDHSLEAVRKTKTFFEKTFGCDFTKEISKDAGDEELQIFINNV